jgi:hypothetical protein
VVAGQPEIASRPLVHHLKDHVVVQPVAPRERSHGAARQLETRQAAAGGPDPYGSAIGIRGQAEHAIALETAAYLCNHGRMRTCRVHAPEPRAVGADQETAVRQREQRTKLSIVELLHVRRFSIAHMGEPRGRADPQASVRGLYERAHTVGR